MKFHTKYRNKNKKIIILQLLLVFSFFSSMTSCQPTPDNEIVINKNDGKIDEIIDSGFTSSVEFTQDETWETNLKKGNVVVNINAEIITPDVSEIPVISVSPTYMTQSHVDKAMEVLFQGTTPYEYVFLTKQKIDEIIITNKMMMEKMKAEDCSDCEEDYASLKQQNESLLKQYNDAPNENDLPTEPADTILKSDENGNSEIELLGKVNNPNLAHILISTNKFTKIAIMEFVNYSKEPTQVIKTPFYSERKLNGDSIVINVEEAKSLAENTISKMGVTDLILIETNVVNFFFEQTEDETVDSDKQAYEFVYSKSHGGVIVSSIFSTVDSTENKVENQYNAVLEPEKLIVQVDDSGIIYFWWYNPTKANETISQNVEILEFDKIKELFNNNIFYHQIYNGSHNDYYINIEKIEFSYFIYPIKDSLDEYRTVPVWDFIGTARIDDKIEYNGDSVSFLTINAIDGSIINRNLGY